MPTSRKGGKRGIPYLHAPTIERAEKFLKKGTAVISLGKSSPAGRQGKPIQKKGGSNLSAAVRKGEGESARPEKNQEGAADRSSGVQGGKEERGMTIIIYGVQRKRRFRKGED